MTELTAGLRHRLEQVEARYEELGRLMSDPETTSDRARLRAVGQEYAALEPIVVTVRELRAAEERLADAQELVNGGDDDLRDLAREDEGTAALDVERLTAQLRTQLVPRDPLDDKNVIVEIRGGEGGEEAALFAGDLYRMYLRYAARHRWKVAELSASRSGEGGGKEGDDVKHRRPRWADRGGPATTHTCGERGTGRGSLGRIGPHEEALGGDRRHCVREHH